MPESGVSINNATSSRVGLTHLFQVFNVIHCWFHSDWEFGCVVGNSRTWFSPGIAGAPWSPHPGLTQACGVPRHCSFVVNYASCFCGLWTQLWVRVSGLYCLALLCFPLALWLWAGSRLSFFLCCKTMNYLIQFVEDLWIQRTIYDSRISG